MKTLPRSFTHSSVRLPASSRPFRGLYVPSKLFLSSLWCQSPHPLIIGMRSIYPGRQGDFTNVESRSYHRRDMLNLLCFLCVGFRATVRHPFSRSAQGAEYPLVHLEQRPQVERGETRLFTKARPSTGRANYIKARASRP